MRPVISSLRRVGDARARFRRTALVERVLEASQRLQDVSTPELRQTAKALCWQARAAAPSERLVVDGFALVREAARRVHGQAHYPTQLAAGIAMASGALAEMQTGEGKTLTALLPSFLHALAGQGVHVVTANDYLAQRDADFARSAFAVLGLRVGCITGALPYERRGDEYSCDVTYGSAREFGFDFLRDRLEQDAGNTTETRKPCRQQQRGRYFALVDEADSVLIDDARTPLIVAVAGELTPEETEFYKWCHRAASSLDAKREMTFDFAKRTIRLTECGARRVASLGPLPAWEDASLERTYRQVEQSLAAQHLYCRDRDYVVDAEGVGMVDPSSGRVAAGRKWRDGLQQAVELTAQIEPTAPTTIAARVTVQNFFRGYAFLAGMTGTALSCSGEFRKVYRLPVIAIPTRKPCVRAGSAPRLFASRDAKFAAVAAEIVARMHAGQAVLVGTPSVEASELLSGVLTNRGIAHAVLNCLRHEQEANIVADAGQPGRVTIATNMAGRGTDIVVSEQVLAAGGLHVIVTEMHASSRIDRQLVGRTARQGARGSFQYFLSLDDEVFAAFEHRAFGRAKREAQRSPDDELPPRWLHWFARAQRRSERFHRAERGELLRQERQRQKTCRDSGLDPLLESVE